MLITPGKRYTRATKRHAVFDITAALTITLLYAFEGFIAHTATGSAIARIGIVWAMIRHRYDPGIPR